MFYYVKQKNPCILLTALLTAFRTPMISYKILYFQVENVYTAPIPSRSVISEIDLFMKFHAQCSTTCCIAGWMKPKRPKSHSNNFAVNLKQNATDRAKRSVASTTPKASRLLLIYAVFQNED